MSYSSEVLADSPWGFWLTGETSGTTLADSSGNGRSLTLVGSSFVLAQPGPSGANDAVAFGTAGAYGQTAVALATSPATLEVWVYVTSYSSSYRTWLMGCAVTSYGNATTDKNLFLLGDGKVRFHVFDGSTRTLDSPAAIGLNAWHHVVASVGAAGMTIRVDKVTVASNPAVTSSFTGSAQRVFLRGGGTNPTVATPSDINNQGPVTLSKPAFYPAQLSSARTDAHYDAMFGPAPVTVALDPFTGSAVALDVTPTYAGPVTVALDPFTGSAVALDVTPTSVAGVTVLLDPFTGEAVAVDVPYDFPEPFPEPVVDPVVAVVPVVGRGERWDVALAYEPPVMAAGGRPT